MNSGFSYILKDFQKFEKGFFWMIIHLIIGVLATFSSLPVILWFYFLVFDVIRAFIFADQREQNFVLFYSMIYFSTFELLGRMSSSYPFIPYESSKYLLLFLAIVGIIFNFEKIKLTNPGFLLILLLLPSLFIDESGQVTFSDLVFNIFGILNIAIGLIFVSVIRIDKWHFVKLIRLMAFPVISVLAYTYIRTPDLDSIEFVLAANTVTSGGFGSNQVSTVLGLGAFLFAMGLILNYRVTTIKTLDIFFLFAFTIQGFLTFSRGGMVAAILGVLAFIYYLASLSQKERLVFNILNPKRYILPIILSSIALFFIANVITGGNLILRYQGETTGTQISGEQVSLNKFTSNRIEILAEDFAIWMQYPIFGSGAASSKNLRILTHDTVSHLEFSRLIAEHGIFGIFIIIFFFRMYFKIKNEKTDGVNKAIQLSFFILAIASSFHAATRTFITPLLVLLSTITITDSDKNKVSKKPMEELKVFNSSL